MVDYTNEIIALINSLKNPRYATQEPPADAPILFDGVLQNNIVTFVANPRDPHDYGVDVWNRAQAGEYGPIGPYTVFPDDPIWSTEPPWPLQPDGGQSPYPQASAAVESYFARCAVQVIKSAPMERFLTQAIVMLNASGGTVPEGPRGAVFNQFAVACGMSSEDLAAMALALETLSFAHAGASATYSATGAIAVFKATMADAVETFNASSPVKIKAPQ